MKRRILSALLALVMILSLVPAQVFAVGTDDAVEAPAQEIVSAEEAAPAKRDVAPLADTAYTFTFDVNQ